MKAILKTSSYIPKEWKRGYLRVNGKFIKEYHKTKRHRIFQTEVNSGDQLDARGGEFLGGDGRSRWDAPKAQWLKMELTQHGELVCRDFDGKIIPKPNWIVLLPTTEQEQE